MTLGVPPTCNTLTFASRPHVVSCASVVGPKEDKGPLSGSFDIVASSDAVDESSWEKAERTLLLSSISHCLSKVQVDPKEVEALLAGDLLNQIISSGYAAREFDAPYFGLYGACSTFVEALILGAVFVDGGYRDPVLCASSSHHYSAERQFRMPTEFAAQRPPQSQWTVTGAGSVLLAATPGPGAEELGVVITSATPGRVVDYDVTDPYDMGSAMAPAAVDTMAAHFRDTNRSPGDYDLILTGDLGRVGHALALDLASGIGLNLEESRFLDTGLLIYSEDQGVDSGGSGCACSAVVFCGHIWRLMMKREAQTALLVGTGAIHSPVACKQGESIPGLAHAILFEVDDRDREE